MKELKGSDWGLKVDKSKATESYPLRGTSFPKESGLNHCSPNPKPNQNGVGHKGTGNAPNNYGGYNFY